MSRKAVHSEAAPAPGSTAPDQPFLAAYYEHVAPEDLQSYSPENLEERATAHRKLADSRPPGAAAVDVLNESDASVLLVVADAMPHLLHSLTAELARENESIRLLVHPAFLVRRDPQTYELLELRPGSSQSWLPASIPGAEEIPAAAGKEPPGAAGEA